MAGGRRWVAVLSAALLLAVVGCSGLGCTGALGVAWWAGSPRGQHVPSQVIVEGCEAAVWYRDVDGRGLFDLAVRVSTAAIQADLRRNGRSEDGPSAEIVRGVLGAIWPREAVACFPDRKRWVLAANPAALPGLWGPIARRFLVNQETVEVAGYRFARGDDAMWGMVDGTLVMGTDEEALRPSVEALIAHDPAPTELRRETAQAVVQGDLAFVAHEKGEGGSTGSLWLSVESPDLVRIRAERRVGSTEEGAAEAQRMCDELVEGVSPARVTCETTWQDGMRYHLDIEVTDIEAALVERASTSPGRK